MTKYAIRLIITVRIAVVKKSIIICKSNDSGLIKKAANMYGINMKGGIAIIMILYGEGELTSRVMSRSVWHTIVILFFVDLFSGTIDPQKSIENAGIKN
ncbi:MAG: hypothetical protein ACFFCS_09355 [Candidatus Hodarchaeota archaeon]